MKAGDSEKSNHRIVVDQKEIEKRKAQFEMFITSGKMRLLEEQIRSLNFAVCTLEDDRRDLERLYNEEKRKHNESKKAFQAGCGGQSTTTP